ncbi:MAG: hypothetical protein A2Y94_08865 [Caldithrix sp. RBG_13_44_9]|nr:MAG: hypothetical protein A2Y94_08865 [Caldithrix sp. RBG_13_44_9]
MYQISQDRLVAAIKKLNHHYPIVLPIQKDTEYSLKFFGVDAWVDNQWKISPIRTPQPLKSFFYPPKQNVTKYPQSEKQVEKLQSLVIIGSKACDINALKIIDKVYREGDYPDPYYLRAREKNIIIASDCLDAGKFCACTLMNSLPYPEKDFDLNLSAADENILIEVGSEQGEKLLKDFFGDIKKASEAQLAQRDKNRQSVIEKLKEINREFQYFQSHQEAIERHLKSKEWKELSKTCVECGICTQICPTCYCFLLFDQPSEKRYERIKVWDSCFFAGYSRMAGGLTPRLGLADRFKHRFYHKFDSFVTNFGVEACTGCGRCSEGCMGNIDLRKVLQELEKKVVLLEKIELS